MASDTKLAMLATTLIGSAIVPDLLFQSRLLCEDFAAEGARRRKRGFRSQELRLEFRSIQSSLSNWPVILQDNLQMVWNAPNAMIASGMNTGRS